MWTPDAYHPNGSEGLGLGAQLSWAVKTMTAASKEEQRSC